jgi:hypothetical protein
MKPLHTVHFLAFLLSLSVLADEHVGTLTELEGLVQIFSHPSDTLPKEKPTKGSLALFEGKYYAVVNAKAGDSVENGNVVRTVPGAKARVVFENGDLFQVGSGTAYRISWDAKSAEHARLQAKIDLMYGKFRGVVSKDGPRKKITLRTPVAVMGVRGTDFFVEENGKTGETEFTIIRGAVEVTPIADASAKGGEKPKTIEVKSGFSAVVTQKVAVSGAATATAVPENKVELRQTAQDELRAIQKVSEVKAETPTGTSKEVATKVEGLKKKALESTLKDIREYQPELHAKLMATPNGSESLESVNAESVNALMPGAPKESPRARRKPMIKDLDSADDESAYKLLSSQVFLRRPDSWPVSAKNLCEGVRSS